MNQGPQYVCTTFSTFVCTNCSGIHREFTHRVKSVSMAKFTPEEVTALQAGSNERAKQIYFKEWNPLRHSYPDSWFQDDERRNRRLSNIASKLKQISIDGQKNVDKSQLPVERPLGEILRENASSLQATHSCGKGSVEENLSEQKNNNPERSIDLSSKSQATHSAAGGRPELPHTTQSNESNWAIFGASTENNDPTTPDTNTSKPSTKKTASEAAIPGKNPVDLLLFELSGPVTPVTGGMPQAASGTNNDPTTTTVDNGTTWDFPSTSVGQTTASPNNTSVWSFTSTPATESAQPSNEVPLHTEVSYAYKTSSMQYVPSVSTVCSSTTQPINSPVKDVASNNQPSLAPSTNDSSGDFTEQSSQTTSSMQCLPPALAGCSSTAQPTNSPVKDVSSNNHPSVTPSTNNSSWGFTEISSQTTSKPTRETRSSGRLELPEDLFTSSYLSGPAPLTGWQNVQPHGMQYYNNAAPPSALPNAPKYSNPFDVTDGRSLIHVSSAFDSQRKTLSNLYDMDQVRNNVNARSLPGSNTLYGSSTVSKEQGPLHRRPDVVKSKQGFPHFRERVWVKKLVHDRRIRFGTWNIGTLTGKSMEIVDVMVRRKINFMCLQETKWTGEKAKELDNSGFKLWYTGKIRSRNGVGIIVDKEWKKDVVDVRRVGDRIIALKLVVGQDTFNVISGYAPQVGLAEHFKVKFWEDLEGVLQDIPQGEKVFLGGDLNGHVGSVARGF
ncbi:putative ADP-ribosylation factor GTPase-activating protein AGD14 [Glycine soja]